MAAKGASSQRNAAAIIAPRRKRQATIAKIAIKVLEVEKVFVILHTQKRNGTLADRLGNGLQNRLEQFDSARYLHKKKEVFNFLLFCF